LTKALRTYNGDKTEFLINGAEKIGYVYGEEWNYISSSNHTQQSTQ
jgi:hypothetical protein